MVPWYQSLMAFVSYMNYQAHTHFRCFSLISRQPKIYVQCKSFWLSYELWGSQSLILNEMGRQEARWYFCLFLVFRGNFLFGGFAINFLSENCIVMWVGKLDEVELWYLVCGGKWTLELRWNCRESSKHICVWIYVSKNLIVWVKIWLCE